jgi:hypothetical protein
MVKPCATGSSKGRLGEGESIASSSTTTTLIRDAIDYSGDLWTKRTTIASST